MKNCEGCSFCKGKGQQFSKYGKHEGDAKIKDEQKIDG
jgi:hypothetical protein